MSPETARRELFPPLNVAAEGLIEDTKRGVFEKAQNCKRFLFEVVVAAWQPKIRTCSPSGE